MKIASRKDGNKMPAKRTIFYLLYLDHGLDPYRARRTRYCPLPLAVPACECNILLKHSPPRRWKLKGLPTHRSAIAQNEFSIIFRIDVSSTLKVTVGIVSKFSRVPSDDAVHRMLWQCEVNLPCLRDRFKCIHPLSI